MPRLLALLVGCDYQNSGRADLPELQGAENDARGLAAVLTGQPLAGGELRHLTLLTGEEATTAQIRQALRRARRAQRPDDNLLFYFAGHGSRSATGVTFYTWDTEYPADLLIRDLGRRPKRTDILLDCCHAGAVTSALHRPARRPMLMLQYKKDQLCFLCGASATQAAGEALGHGLFTQTLITTLTAPHDPPLLSLPISLDNWCDALPASLQQQLHTMSSPADALPPIQRGHARLSGQPDAPADSGQTWQTSY